MADMGISTSPSSRRRTTRTAVWLTAGLTAAWVALVLVFRTKWPPAIALIRRLNRAALNPAMLVLAGRARSYASVVHHIGRRSGRSYVTPVLAERSGNRLYIPLPYGMHVDWLANVLAAGFCEVEHKGERFSATTPAVVPAAEAGMALRPRPRALLDLYGVTDYLRLDVVG